MTNSGDYLKEVGTIVSELEDLGLKPVLIGGMALVILGSRRVTRDFDFLVSLPGVDLEKMVDLFYQRGLELASRLNKEGEIVSTVDNKKVASIRLRLDSPPSAFFLNRKTGLRIDLLFDFPLPAGELADRSIMKRVRSHLFRVASRKDLLRLKKIARSRRTLAADAEDLEFLRRLRPTPSKTGTRRRRLSPAS